MLAAALALGSAAAPTGAETLRDALRATGLRPPDEPAAELGRPLARRLTFDLAAGVVVIGATERGDLIAARFDRTAGRWLVRPLAAAPPRIADPNVPDPAQCGSLADLWPWGGRGGVRVTLHLNPSAACTLLVAPDLGVAAALWGWPLAELGDRLVYHRSQVHFAPVHPVEIALFDPRRGESRTIYPARPFGRGRLAHIARARAALTPAVCAARNHPCDPEWFDERLAGDVAVSPAADALAFVTELDASALWSEPERARLDAVRELREALSVAGGGAVGGTSFDAVATGLARLRALGAEARVGEVLGADPAALSLVEAALARPPRAGQPAREWLLGLDPRWGGPVTWRRIARALVVPGETTALVYVYRGLGDPATTEWREVPLEEFRARFGTAGAGGGLGRALEPEALRRLFDGRPPAAPTR